MDSHGIRMHILGKKMEGRKEVDIWDDLISWTLGQLRNEGNNNPSVPEIRQKMGYHLTLIDFYQFSKEDLSQKVTRPYPGLLSTKKALSCYYYITMGEYEDFLDEVENEAARIKNAMRNGCTVM